MKSILKLLLLLPVLAISNLTNAQEKFERGFVTDLNGNRLNGMISTSNWTSPEAKIVFREDGKEGGIGLTPSQIKGFEVGSDKYFSADVLTEMTSSNLNLLTTDPELNLERGTVFLKAVVLGTKSLFYFKNRMFNDQFYIQKDSEYVLLAYKRYLREAVNSSAVGENRGFVNQLKNYFSDCDKLDSKLLAASYEEKSLVSLFEKYFECTGISSEFTAKREKVKIETGVVAGVSYTGMEEDYFAYYGLNFKPSVNPAAGLFLNVFIPGTRGRVSIYNELLYSSYLLKSPKHDADDGEFSLGFSYLKMNNLVRLSSAAKRVRAFVNIGISNGIAIREVNDARTMSSFDDTFLDHIRKYEQGLLAGVGFSVGKLSAEARVEFGNGFSKSDDYPTSVTRGFLIVGYRF